MGVGTLHARRMWIRLTHSAPLRWSALILLVLLLVIPSPALADGIKFGERMEPVPPNVPAQKAFIAHRDGMETLIVESTLDGVSQSYGWILPLPAKPTRIEVASSGALDALDGLTRPELVHESEPLWVMAGLLALFSVLPLGVAVDRVTHRPSRALGGLVVLGLLIVGLAVVATPNLLAAKLGSGPGLEVGVASAETVTVGSYTVTTLELTAADGLDRWLDSEGLSRVPTGGRYVVETLLREGWVFVAVRLRRDEGGLSIPHPLSLTFPAPKPIYPMRITALGGGTTEVRLTVASPVAVATPSMTATFRDRVEMRSDGASWRFTGIEPAPVEVAQASGGRVVAHEGIVAHLRTGDVVVRFEGRFNEAAMARDIVFEPGPADPLRLTFYSDSGALYAVAMPAALVWFVLAFLILLLGDARLPGIAGRRMNSLQWMAWLALGVLAIAAVVWWCLPRVIVREIRGRPATWSLVGRTERALEGMDPVSDGSAGTPMQQVARAIEARRDQRSGMTHRGDGPLQWDAIEDGRGVVIRLRDENGGLHEVEWAALRAEVLTRNLPLDSQTNAATRAVIAERVIGERLATGEYLNHLTGEPLRFGTGPGEVSVLDLTPQSVLRVHFRDGLHRDIEFR